MGWQVWFKHQCARRCNQVDFDPSWQSVSCEGVLNMFTGFNVQPSAVGSCARLLQHHNEVGMPPPPPAAVFCIQTNAPPCRPGLQVLCAGDPETIKYSMQWWARCGPCMQPPPCASMAVPRHPATPAIALAAPPCSGRPSACPWPRPGLPAAIAGVAARAVLLLQWCCGCERCPIQCRCATSATLPVAPKVPEHCQWPNALVWPVQCH